MVSLMQRRREMMQTTGASPLPEWDYEWDWSDGIMSNNGWTKTYNGTVYEEVQTSDQRVRTGARRTDNWIKLTRTSLNTSTGVLQVHHVITGSNNWFVELTLGNGTGGIRVRFQFTSSYQGIYLVDSSNIANMTKLTSLAGGTEHTTKLLLNGSYADVYDNNVMLVSNVSISSIVGATDTEYYFEDRSTSTRYHYLHDIKMKLGRTT